MKALHIMSNVILIVLLALALPQAATAELVITEGDGYTQVDGVVREAPFRLVRPDDWNGDLVVLLHGYIDPDDPITIPLAGPQGVLFEQLTDEWVARGYSVAYSSYRVNGYAVRAGTFDSRIAQWLFAYFFGPPTDTFLTSFSMGTHIGQRLIETTPGRYAGFLAVCAAVGGATLQNDYFYDARVLFDYFYPGVLPGDVLTADLDFFTEVFPLAFAAVVANPLPAFEMAAVLDIRWTTPEELVEGVISSLILAGGGTIDMQEKAGGNPYDNTVTVYTGSSDDAALNAGVGRFAADWRAERYLRRYYDPRGRLHGTEVLQLHTTRDPIVQLERHQPVFEELLVQSGEQDLYAVRAVERFGHCTLSNDEILASFDDLVVWSRTGVKPTP